MNRTFKLIENVSFFEYLNYTTVVFSHVRNVCTRSEIERLG